MKAVILAGGYGTRISEETSIKPKPLIEIGGMPILWHIMKNYSVYGINDFVICCGYKGYMIKEYFANYSLHMSDVTIDLQSNNIEIHKKFAEPWKITLIDTGVNTMTGGRLKRIQKYVDDDFCFTYGDGLSDINIQALIDFHKSQNKKATVTAVRPPGRFGTLQLDEQNLVSDFIEKPIGDGGWINGGFFVLKTDVFDYIENDKTIWERKPLEQLSHESELAAFKHEGFWQPLDTLREKNNLEKLWSENNSPWKLW
jgi:glucose-1-phosphate cytidylyltransferase